MRTFTKKTMALAMMIISMTIPACAETWTDEETGIAWTYTVLDDGTVAIGGGSNTSPAVPTTTEGELTVPAQINGLDVTSVMNHAFYNCKKLTSISFESGAIVLQKNASAIFRNCYLLDDIGFPSSWDTGSVTNMSYMFANCKKLSSLTSLAGWDVSKVTNMSHMFEISYTSSSLVHSSITSIEPLANWDVSRVTNMSYMFANSRGITSLDPITDWNTGKLTNMSNMFYWLYKLASLEPLADWDVSNVTNMNYLFYECSGIPSLEPLANWNTGKLTTMNNMFCNCALVTSLEPLASWDVSNVTSMQSVFADCSGIPSLEPITNWNVSNVTDMQSMFLGCSGVTSIEPVANWDTSKVTNMKYLFRSIAMTTLEPLAGWDVGNVTDMYGMFYNCSGVTSLEPLANWNVSKVTSMGSMFSECDGITSLEPLANWDVSSVTNMSNLFSHSEKIASVEPLENWNVGKVTDMDGMFRSTAITTLEPIGGWDVGNVTTMRYMFANCENLSYANELNNWDISQVKKMQEMFAFSGLVYINMSSWDVTNVDMTNMFAFQCQSGYMLFPGTEDYYHLGMTPRLERVYLPKKGMVKLASCLFNGCTSLKEVTIPSTATAIREYAFQNCTSLKEITIPSKVTAIGERAFYGCESMQELYSMATTPPTIQKYTFNNVGDKTLYVKTTALDAYKTATTWKNFGTITDIIPIVIGADKNYSTLSFDFDADFSETDGVQPYIATKYLEGEEAADYLSGFEAKKRLSSGMRKAATAVNKDIKLIVLARYPDGYVPSRTGEENFDFHGVILYGQPGTYYFKMGEQDFASDNQKTVSWSTNYMMSAYESWLLNPIYDHKPVNWMEYPKKDTYNFVLKSNKFKYIDNAGTINRHKAWLELPAEKVSGTYFASDAKMISLFDPEDYDSFASGLSFVVEDMPSETQCRYNLHGQKVDASYKGIVITKGSKILNE